MTPEKFIHRLREIIPGAQKSSLPDLLKRIETMKGLEHIAILDYLDCTPDTDEPAESETESN